ncbi:MAG: hypothetical protein Q9221_006385 [Calogaya cf. arnoldii]
MDAPSALTKPPSVVLEVAAAEASAADAAEVAMAVEAVEDTVVAEDMAEVAATKVEEEVAMIAKVEEEGMTVKAEVAMEAVDNLMVVEAISKAEAVAEEAAGRFAPENRTSTCPRPTRPLTSGRKTTKFYPTPIRPLRRRLFDS